MIQANTVLEAWDKTFETMDFSHLAQYLSEDFQVEYTTGEVDNLEDTKSWCVEGGLRINNFKTIRENANYIVATHDVVQEGKPKSSVLVYAEQNNGKFTYWLIQRAFEV
jgi:zona occludens toxin (predicted ATPase)